MSADGKIPAARITPGVSIVVELGPAPTRQPVNPPRKGSGYAARVEQVQSAVYSRRGQRATRRYVVTTDLGTLNLAPAETVWIVDALPARSYTAVTSRTAALLDARPEANRTPEQIAADHMANRCADVTSRHPDGRPRSCRCTEEIRDAKRPAAGGGVMWPRGGVVAPSYRSHGGQLALSVQLAVATDEHGTGLLF